MGKTAIVTGAGGFIGGHLVQRLLQLPDYERIVAVDVKRDHEWYQRPDTTKALVVSNTEISPYHDEWYALVDALMQNGGQIDEVYHLAADMGGIGFIETNRIKCMESMLTTWAVMHALDDSTFMDHRPKVLYTSSACGYPVSIQTGRGSQTTWLREDQAYPADPEDGYGWEKLTSERIMRHYREEAGFPTYVARLHNVYGPYGTYDGGREKAPAAICRKVIEAQGVQGDGTIRIWGDGLQTRSFMYVDDCVSGLIDLMKSDHHEPINLGSSTVISINELVQLVIKISGRQPSEFTYVHEQGKPLGVAGRSSDNTLWRSVIGWEPSTPLLVGLTKTYEWILEEMTK